MRAVFIAIMLLFAPPYAVHHSVSTLVQFLAIQPQQPKYFQHPQLSLFWDMLRPNLRRLIFGGAQSLTINCAHQWMPCYLVQNCPL